MSDAREKTSLDREREYQEDIFGSPWNSGFEGREVACRNDIAVSANRMKRVYSPACTQRTPVEGLRPMRASETIYIMSTAKESDFKARLGK